MNKVHTHYLEILKLNIKVMKKTATLHFRERNLTTGIDNSPYKATFEYPEGYQTRDQKFNETQKHLHPSKRKYLHPHEGYEIGYGAYMNYVRIGEATHPEEIS